MKDYLTFYVYKEILRGTSSQSKENRELKNILFSSLTQSFVLHIAKVSPVLGIMLQTNLPCCFCFIT